MLKARTPVLLRVAVIAPREPGLGVDRDDRDLPACDHPAELLEALAVGLGSGLRLVADDNGIARGNPESGEPGTDLAFLIGAAVSPLHFRRVAGVNDDLLANHGIPPTIRDEFRQGCDPMRISETSRWTRQVVTRFVD